MKQTIKEILKKLSIEAKVYSAKNGYFIHADFAETKKIFVPNDNDFMGMLIDGVGSIYAHKTCQEMPINFDRRTQNVEYCNESNKIYRNAKIKAKNTIIETINI